MCICIYIYIYMCICIYIYIERERDTYIYIYTQWTHNSILCIFYTMRASPDGATAEGGAARPQEGCDGGRREEQQRQPCHFCFQRASLPFCRMSRVPIHWALSKQPRPVLQSPGKEIGNLVDEAQRRPWGEVPLVFAPGFLSMLKQRSATILGGSPVLHKSACPFPSFQNALKMFKSLPGSGRQFQAWTFDSVCLSFSHPRTLASARRRWRRIEGPSSRLSLSLSLSWPGAHLWQNVRTWTKYDKTYGFEALL